MQIRAHNENLKQLKKIKTWEQFFPRNVFKGINIKGSWISEHVETT